jgi:hypothetical protein
VSLITHRCFPPGGIDIAETTRLYQAGLAKDTNTAYHGHYRKYIRWAVQHGLDSGGRVPRPSEDELMIFAQFLQRTVGPGAVNSTLAGVTAGFVERGMTSVVKDAYGAYLPRLRRLIRGIKKLKGAKKPKRLALTVDKLRRLITELRAACGGSVYDATAYAAAFATGVYLLLRVGEMTSSKIREHNPEQQLNLGDVEIYPSLDDPQWMVLRVKASKTDCFREGIDLKAFANGDSTCAVMLMAEWLKTRVGTDPSQPLFVLSDATFVTRDRLQRVLKKGIELAGYDPTHWNTHSMRIGGASTLASQNWPAETIMLMGRWSSACYVQYLRMNDVRRKKIAASMAAVSTETMEDAKARGVVGKGYRWSKLDEA